MVKIFGLDAETGEHIATIDTDSMSISECTGNCNECKERKSKQEGDMERDTKRQLPENTGRELRVSILPDKGKGVDK